MLENPSKVVWIICGAIWILCIGYEYLFGQKGTDFCIFATAMGVWIIGIAFILDALDKSEKK